MRSKRDSVVEKTRAALEAIRGQKTLHELAAEDGVHLSQITQWKKQAPIRQNGASHSRIYFCAMRKEEQAVRYMLLIYGSEADAAAMTQEEREALMQGHAAFAQDVLARRILVGGAPLQPTRAATTVRVRKGKRMITDGPFAETKEQLAGMYILECQHLDEAIELAARIPGALRGSVEIRPMMELEM